MRIAMHNVALFVVVFIFTVSSLPKFMYADSKNNITLKSAIETTLRTNPEFSTVINSRYIAEENLKQGKSLYKPSLDLRAEFGYEKTKTPVISDEDLMKRQVSLTMTQLLFDGANTSNLVKREKAKLKSADYEKIETAELLSLNVINSFLNVIRSRKLMKNAKRNIDGHIKILKKIKDGARNGRFNKGDLAQITSRVARAKASFETIKQSLTESEASYINLVGIKPVNNMQSPKTNLLNLPKDLPVMIEQAKTSNPALEIFRYEIDAAHAEYKQARSNNLPKVELQLSGTQGEDLGGIEGDETLASALMVMRWNLFRGGADKSLIKEAFYQEEIAKDAEIRAIRNLENEVRNTWAAMKASSNQTKEFEKQVLANKKVVEVYKDQFTLNRRSLIDLLNTQNELFLSENNAINAAYSKKFAEFRLAALRGSLLKDLNIDERSYNNKPSGDKEINRELNFKNSLIAKNDKANLIIKPQKKPVNIETAKVKNVKIKKAKNNSSKPSTAKKLVNIKNSNDAINLTHYAQFGAFKTRAEAKEMLGFMLEEYNDLFGKLDTRIEKADLGKKGIYHRLQAGPITKKHALGICDELNIRDTGGCFIVSK